MDADDEEMLLLASTHQRLAVVALEACGIPKKRKIDPRKLPHEARRSFRHKEALNCILYDCLGPKPLFDGREFELMFRLSRRRFQCLMEDVGNSCKPFYTGKSTDCFGRDAASLEAKVFVAFEMYCLWSATTLLHGLFFNVQDPSQELLQSFSMMLWSICI